MSVVDLRAAIVSGLKTQLGTLAKSVQAHGGRFTPEELARYSAQMPAVFVACLGIGKLERQGGEPYAHFEWSVAVAAKDGAKAGDRAETVLLVGAEVTRLIALSRWGLDGASAAELIEGRNVYSSELDKTGAAIWMTAWRQAMPLQPLTAAQLAAFNMFVDSFDLAPADGVIDASDQVAMEQI